MEGDSSSEFGAEEIGRLVGILSLKDGWFIYSRALVGLMVTIFVIVRSSFA